MDVERFLASLGAAEPPEAAGPLLEALWHDARGGWDRAHALVQAQEGPDAAAVHAYLHRKEGDLANADYWYARAGRKRFEGDLQMEWRALVEALAAQRKGPAPAGEP